MQIAIDTSTDFATLALVQGYEILGRVDLALRSNHTIELFPRLDFLIEKSNKSLKEADCIFVAMDRGALTGLRVGVSAAKGLAFSLVYPSSVLALWKSWLTSIQKPDCRFVQFRMLAEKR